jgi:hypothetical protein
VSKRNLAIIAIVFIAVIAVFSVKILAGKGKVQKSDKSSLTLEGRYDKVIKSSKPSIIVFSYDADCCESTKKFFDEYNTKARIIMKAYENRFETLFINTGTISSKEDNDALVKIANDSKVSKLPSILILDGKGIPVKIFEGVFDDKEVRKALDEVVS